MSLSKEHSWEWNQAYVSILQDCGLHVGKL